MEAVSGSKCPEANQTAAIKNAVVRQVENRCLSREFPPGIFGRDEASPSSGADG